MKKVCGLNAKKKAVVSAVIGAMFLMGGVMSGLCQNILMVETIYLTIHQMDIFGRGI